MLQLGGRVSRGGGLVPSVQDGRHKTHTLIPALPLVHAERREILPLPGPQFPTCKMGRSSTHVQGCGGGRQEVGEGQG